MSRVFAFSLAALACLCSARASAQACKAAPSLGGVLASRDLGGLERRVGEWAEYAVVENGKVRRDEVFRVVVGGRQGDVAWLELWLDRGGRRAVRVGGPPGPAVLKLNGTYFALPEDAAAPGACRERRPTEADAANARREVTVRTPAGAFRSRYAVEGTGKGRAELWSSDAVPALGLVRLRFAGGRGFELVASGRGSPSAFPEKVDAAPLPLEGLEALRGLLPGP